MRKHAFIFAAMLLGSIGLHAGNTITYKASARLSGYYGSLSVGATTFGPAIISHEFFYGVGTITCSGEITQIGDGAFQRCSNLSSVTIPNSVTTIRSNAFYESGLTSIEIPSSVTALGEYVFMDCSRLSSVTIPNSIEILPMSTFLGCTSLKSIEIPSSVTTIGISAFGSTGLTSVTIPASVKEIDERAFRHCTGLSSVKVNWTDAQSIVSLSIDVFEEIANGAGPQGATLYVPEGTANLYKQANVWKEFGSITIHKNTITYTASEKLPGYDGSLDVGKTTFGPAITSHTFSNGTGTITCSGEITTIGEGAFRGCIGLTSITILNSVTTIGICAFQNCTNLTSITIPNSVTTIGQAAFSRCGLTSITIPNSVTQIGRWAFEYCNNLQNIDIPSSIKSIDVGTFQWAGLTSITIPASVGRIENFAFWDCPLEYVECKSETPPALGNENVFPNDKKAFLYVPTSDAVITYRNSPWSNWFKDIISNFTYDITSTSTAELTFAVPVNGRVDIPSTVLLQGNFYTVTSIGKGAFYYPNKDNEDLQYITLPPTMKYIGADAFKRCTKLANLLLPEDLETIGDSAFYGCANLDSITIPEGVYTVGHAAFMGCRRLVYVDLDATNKLRNIPDECFRDCGLREITIPEGIKTIDRQGFSGNNSLHMIELPTTLGNINAGAFDGCNAIDTVICRAENPPALGEKVFSHSNTAVLYVPHRDVMKTYQNSSWKNYKFRFADLMAEENKQYLHFVAGSNAEALEIAKAYCDSINNATTTRQVEYFTNTALVKIDKYTLNDYKINLANQLDSIAAGNTDAERIADDYRLKLIHALFRDDAEKLFAEGLAKIKAIWDLVNLKAAYCDNLRGSAQNLGEDMIKVANDYCSRIQRATSKQEADKIYKEGAQEIAMYVHRLRYWIVPSDDTCKHTQGYQY